MRTRYYRAWLLYVRVKTSSLVTVCIHDKSMAHVGCDSVVGCGVHFHGNAKSKRVTALSAFRVVEMPTNFLEASNFDNFAPDRA
jgi:hypothetical protein